jgi:transposase
MYLGMVALLCEGLALRTLDDDNHDDADHQSHEPDEIKIEPGAAQNGHTQLFVHQKSDERRQQEVSDGVHPRRRWLPSAEERDVRVLLHHRHRLVEMRRRAKNGLQALALSHHLCQGPKRWTAAGQQALQALKRREAASRRWEDLRQLVTQLNGWIQEAEYRLEQEAEKRPEVQRLRTPPGVGLLTALATVVVLGPVERFANGRKVASYGGMIPSEHSSGGRQRFGPLTKQGNRLLRFLLVEAAQSACRWDPEFKQDYKRVAFRHGWARARVMVARKLAIRLYIMLRDQIDYAEFVRRGSSAGMPGVALV